MKGNKNDKVRVSMSLRRDTKEYLETGAKERGLSVSGFVDYLVMVLKDKKGGHI